MLAWRIAATTWLFRWIFRDPKVDVRFLMAGVILPDVVDLAVGTVFVPNLASGELWAHSLVLPTVAMAVILISTRRGRRRRAWMALTIGWLFHLLLDGMWLNENVFFWPFFGLEMPGASAPFWPLAWERALSDPWRWVLEAIGVTYLVWLARESGLGSAHNRKVLRSTGRLGDERHA